VGIAGDHGNGGQAHPPHRSGDWTFVKRQEAASSLKSPGGASDCSPRRQQRQELGTLVPPWVSVSTICSLSPNTCFVLGERARVRGKTRLTCNDYASCQETFEYNETRDSPLGNQWPPSLNLSPRIAQKRAIRGERRRMGRNADPGRRERLLPSLAPGANFRRPLQGSQDEATASLPLHFSKNVQSQDRYHNQWSHLR